MALSEEVCPTKNEIHVLHHAHREYQNVICSVTIIARTRYVIMHL